MIKTDDQHMTRIMRAAKTFGISAEQLHAMCEQDTIRHKKTRMGMMVNVSDLTAMVKHRKPECKDYWFGRQADDENDLIGALCEVMTSLARWK